MLGFDLDFWDYATFASFAIVAVAGVVVALLIAGLPGRIAIARKHPDAEAVNIMGYAGFLPLVPWIQAFIWAFKPTDIVDIRRFPKEEARAVDEDIARLEANPRMYGRHAEATDPETPRHDPLTPPHDGAKT